MKNIQLSTECKVKNIDVFKSSKTEQLLCKLQVYSIDCIILDPYLIAWSLTEYT